MIFLVVSIVALASSASERLRQISSDIDLRANEIGTSDGFADTSQIDFSEDTESEIVERMSSKRMFSFEVCALISKFHEECEIIKRRISALLRIKIGGTQQSMLNEILETVEKMPPWIKELTRKTHPLRRELILKQTSSGLRWFRYRIDLLDENRALHDYGRDLMNIAHAAIEKERSVRNRKKLRDILKNTEWRMNLCIGFNRKDDRKCRMMIRYLMIQDARWIAKHILPDFYFLGRLSDRSDRKCGDAAVVNSCF